MPEQIDDQAAEDAKASDLHDGDKVLVTRTMLDARQRLPMGILDANINLRREMRWIEDRLVAEARQHAEEKGLILLEGSRVVWEATLTVEVATPPRIEMSLWRRLRSRWGKEITSAFSRPQQQHLVLSVTEEDLNPQEAWEVFRRCPQGHPSDPQAAHTVLWCESCVRYRALCRNGHCMCCGDTLR